LRIREQETRLILPEYDDDDDEELSYKKSHRKFTQKFPEARVPNMKTIYNHITSVQPTGSILDAKRTRR